MNTHSDSGGNTVVDIHQDVKIPFPVPTEGIQAGVSITIPQDASSISISGAISGSPSFEVNVSVDGGPVQNIPLQEESENDVAFGANLQTTNEVNKTEELKKEEKK